MYTLAVFLEDRMNISIVNAARLDASLEQVCAEPSVSTLVFHSNEYILR